MIKPFQNRRPEEKGGIRRHRTVRAVPAAAVCLLFLTAVNAGPAWAAEEGAEITAALVRGAGVLRSLGISMAVLALAVTGLQALTGGSQEALKLWPRFLLIVTALAALLTLPYMIRMGRALAVRAWEPDAPASSAVDSYGGWGEFHGDSVL